MTYIPDKDGRARNIALSFIVFGVVLYGISNFISYGALFQVVAAVLLVAGVFTLVRYVLTDFVYIIDDLEDGNSDLVIIKKQGKKAGGISAAYQRREGNPKRSLNGI